MSFQRECAAFWTPNHGCISLTTGTAGAVAFDFLTIWPLWRLEPQTIAVMVHTHPPGCICLSSTDRNMVYGWCLALRAPILFVVVCEEAVTEYWCVIREGRFILRDLGLAGHCSFPIEPLIARLRELSAEANP